MKKIVGVVAVVALFLAAIGSVGLVVLNTIAEDSPRTSSRPPRPSPTPPEESVTEAPEPSLRAFYSQVLAWKPCESNTEHHCTTLEVPVDYEKPRGETIDLALLRVPAQGQPTGSLVVNPGGPGAPGTEYAAAASLVFRRPLLEQFDIVGFDPRGTGRSAPVDCFTDAEMDDYIAGDPDPDTPAEEQEFIDSVRSFGASCAERTGELLGHVTTIEAARDMDVLRAALGEEELTYFGASYGTKLGATYAELFPERVGRFVLDGAVDVSLDNRQLSLEQAAGFETALRAYVQNCLDVTDDCFLGDSVEEGLQTISDFLDAVDQQPLPAGDRELRVGNAFYGIVAPLYNSDYWYALSAALTAGLEGNGAPLLQLSDLYTSREDGRYTDNSTEAIYAINCLDDPTSIPVSEVPAQFAEFEEASPTFGRVFAWGLAGCGGLTVTSSEESLDIRAEGAAPILVLGTTRDPATPLRWAEALADQLESGVLVRRDGDGHTAYNMKNECVDYAVEDYLIEGVVPEDGTDC
ncbi:MAG: Probable exported protease [uncultured Nocardioides sp.]|uniref:Probable exported protease n=1 Tax=uncultured Nocardioides sp. TaxID=198441 RepID=A0A6J4NUT7_9ACTN|nr:MAG: Probable exported protease [uncultured Nocardioides sp.]